MTMRSAYAALVGGVALALLGVAPEASAQFDNRPFQFRGGASVGMSDAGRQAILRQKLYDETPNNLVRGPSGQLLQVEQGPGKSAVVSRRGGGVIPGFRGRTLFGPPESVGVFNAFFGPQRSAASSGGAFHSGGYGTRISIASWTDLVAEDGPTGYIPAGPNPVDSWTSQVFVYFAN